MTTLSALSTLHNKINYNIRLQTYSASYMHIRIYIIIYPYIYRCTYTHARHHIAQYGKVRAIITVTFQYVYSPMYT